MEVCVRREDVDGGVDDKCGVAPRDVAGDAVNKCCVESRKYDRKIWDPGLRGPRRKFVDEEVKGVARFQNRNLSSRAVLTLRGAGPVLV